MKTAIVLASGPSLTLEQIKAAKESGFFTLAVNATFQKMLDADAMYSGDFLFFKTYQAEIRRDFKGKVWTQDSSAAARWPWINRMRGANRDGLGTERININGNSGVQAINLAFLWGHKKIVLLGFDMKLGPKGERHHHADHPAPCVQNQTFGEWLHKLELVARDARKHGVEITNCTPGSAMHCFVERDWKEVIA